MSFVLSFGVFPWGVGQECYRAKHTLAKTLEADVHSSIGLSFFLHGPIQGGTVKHSDEFCESECLAVGDP